MKRFQAIFDFFKVVFAVLLTAVLIRTYGAQPYIVDGSSMEPSYHNGEYVVIEKVSYRFHQPSRGDVIVFQYPYAPVKYIKRVIGLPGDTIRIENDKVFINGTQLTENYLAPGEITVAGKDANTPYEVTVGKDQFFVLGDNRQHSADSREGWLVSKDLIVGRSALVLYPHSSSTTQAATP